MSGNVKVTWVLPTERENGRPLPLDEIAGTDVSFRVVGAPTFTPIPPRVGPTDPQEVTVSDMDPGEWEFQCVVVDVKDNESTPEERTVSVPFSNPNPVSNMTVTVS